MSAKHVLFSVLNWGLGHACRSIPVIEALHDRNIKVTVASDGLALNFLKNRFPDCCFLELPELDITYTDRGSQTLAVGKSIIKNSTWYTSERDIIKRFLQEHEVHGIISDNRPTAHDPEIHSVYITHQLKVRAGFLTPIASLGHANFYKRYHEIWVPDIDDIRNLSGDLSRTGCNRVVKFIGPLSDLKPTKSTTRYDLGVILSGPEPQRTILEDELTIQLAHMHSVWLVRGTEKPINKPVPANWKITDVADRETVRDVFASCRTLISRNGYTTLMDLHSNPKPAVLIPTPGQPEQQYLATLRIHQDLFAHGNQDKLRIKKLLNEAMEKGKNQNALQYQRDWDKLFMPFLG